MGNICPPRVPLQTTVVDELLRFQHHFVLGLNGVNDFLGARIKLAHQVINCLPNTGGINSNIGHVINAAKFANLLRLPVKIQTVETLLIHNTENPALNPWRCDNHQRGIILRAAGVVTNPHRRVIERARGERGVVLPQRPRINHAALQFRHFENTVRVIDELAHEQVFKLPRREFNPQFFHRYPIEAAVNGVLNGNYLAEIAILA